MAEKIENIQLSTWDDFKEYSERILTQFRSKKKDKDSTYYSEPLFRGQANEEWELKTTLERYLEEEHNLEEEECSVSDYYHIVRNAKPIIESFIDHEFEEISMNFDFDGAPRVLPNYKFLSYLRHYGFPSPLLDWSRSPYVASFFAFKECNRQQSDNVAIYAYKEFWGHGKTYSKNDWFIIGHGPTVVTHKRHWLQQCEYTACLRKKDNGGLVKYVFKKHSDEVFNCGDINDNGESIPQQDIIIKLLIPSSERKKALRDLYYMNINEYTLFNDETSLINYAAWDSFFHEKYVNYPKTNTYLDD